MGDSVRIFELLEEPRLVGGAAESAAHATAGDSARGDCLWIVVFLAH